MSVNKPRGNTQRQKPEEAAAPLLSCIPRLGTHFHQPKNTLAWGTFFIILGLILETSFSPTSSLGLSDQSVLDGLGHSRVGRVMPGRQTRNFLGVLGAVVSHIFVYRWFGLGALLLPLVPFVAGWKMAFGWEILPLSKTTKEAIFFTLWVSVLMGHIILMRQYRKHAEFLSGGFGYSRQRHAFRLAEMGSVMPILFVSIRVCGVLLRCPRRYKWQQAQGTRSPKSLGRHWRTMPTSK